MARAARASASRHAASQAGSAHGACSAVAASVVAASPASTSCRLPDGSCQAPCGSNASCVTLGIERVEPRAQRLGGRQVAAAHDEVGPAVRGERGRAQEQVVVRDRRAAAPRAAERVGEQRPAEALARRRHRLEPRLGAPGDDDGPVGVARHDRERAPRRRRVGRGLGAQQPRPAAGAAGPTGRRPSSAGGTSGSRSAKFRCTGPGRPSSAVQTARQASIRIQRRRSGVASCVPTSKNHFAAEP